MCVVTRIVNITLGRPYAVHDLQQAACLSRWGRGDGGNVLGDCPRWPRGRSIDPSFEALLTFAVKFGFHLKGLLTLLIMLHLIFHLYNSLLTCSSTLSFIVIII